MTGPSSRPPAPLGLRAEAVFDALHDGRGADLHPDDRAEAEAFWEWLGRQDAPAVEDGATPPLRRGWRMALTAAAAALALTVGGRQLYTGAGTTAAPAATEYAAGHAERRVVRLADGSTVTLAADSRVAVRLTPTRRDLRLIAGEALFQVAHDTARPFVVATPHGEVRAVGTAFDVALRAGDASVAVVDGTIRIALRDTGPGAAEPIVKLASRGERVAFGTARRDGQDVGFISQSVAADPETITAWTRGKLVFRGEPLSEVVATVNRYATEQLRLTDRRRAATPVFGVVDQGDVAAVRDLIDDPDALAISRAALAPVSPTAS